MPKTSTPQRAALFEQTLGILRSQYWQASSFQDVEVGGTDCLVAEAPEPLGDPKCQCWKFTLRDPKIKGTHDAELGNDGNCVFLQSAAVDDCVAVFVICCKKEDGKCKDCRAQPQLQVKDGNNFIATKKVSITCRSGG